MKLFESVRRHVASALVLPTVGSEINGAYRVDLNMFSLTLSEWAMQYEEIVLCVLTLGIVLSKDYAIEPILQIMLNPVYCSQGYKCLKN